MKRSTTLFLAAASLLGLTSIMSACGGGNGAGKTATPSGSVGASTASAARKLNVVTTVAPLTNIVLNVAGDRIKLTGIIPDGVDSHTFEPSPENAKQLAAADIFIMNGAHLEGSTEKIARQSMKDPGKIYHLADNTYSGPDDRNGFLFDFSFPRDKGDPNPHLWMDPKNAGRYADLVDGWLTQNDPANKSYYDANTAAFKAAVEKLDQAIRAATPSVPRDQRKLLTYHDSWAYWAREYDWTVIGAIQPSDFAEPSAKDVAALIDQIKQEHVQAVFGSEVYPSPVTQQIARETGAKYVTSLRDDEPPGAVDAPEHTYVGMLIDDMRAIFTNMGGTTAPFDNFPVQNTYQKD